LPQLLTDVVTGHRLNQMINQLLTKLGLNVDLNVFEDNFVWNIAYTVIVIISYLLFVLLLRFCLVFKVAMSEKKKSVFKYTEKDLHDAVKAIQTSKHKIREAERMYNVPHST